MPAALSIDWDAFVPEKLEWDLGHRETQFHINDLWYHRGHLLDEMKTSGEEADFWTWIELTNTVSTNEIGVGESHLFHLDTTLEIDHIILVDAHHDVFGEPRQDGKVDCGNWLAYWLAERPDGKVTWLRPEHTPHTVPKWARSRFTVLPLFTTIHEDIVDVYACRSGAWTPPWLDQAFIEFIERSRLNTNVVQGTPLTPRWGEAEYEQFNALREQEMAFIKGFKHGNK